MTYIVFVDYCAVEIDISDIVRSVDVAFDCKIAAG